MITPADANKKPLPIPDGDTAPFWVGLRDGKLLLQHCSRCRNVQYYQQQLCRACGSEELVHKAASGRGKVHSFSVVHRAPGPAFKDEVPYAVLLVELAEGPRMISSYLGGPPEDVTFDMSVELAFDKLNDDITLPRFRKLQPC
ncbi:Zn-ribbon domain-containing OB-fold protein [Bradyrhizobium elkanii]|uniref:Zn-ribbon domain-containing OB-fold protein n=1 Tax=Bradyrhizobium elkanii TaxID=29448 RepID=UPI0020A1E13E|nr:OB-fold domain-containing protein [Bradyrhizobium elkanii]MCP1968228.1 putative OB-fold protein [Bradyrhizobium elkanii]MCS4110272.1 putative OB-fold protein [Bradyrhizobium elkanii]